MITTVLASLPYIARCTQENVCRKLLTKLLVEAHREKVVGEALTYCVGEVCRVLSALYDVSLNFCVDDFVEYYESVKGRETIKTVHGRLEQSWILGWNTGRTRRTEIPATLNVREPVYFQVSPRFLWFLQLTRFPHETVRKQCHVHPRLDCKRGPPAPR